MTERRAPSAQQSSRPGWTAGHWAALACQLEAAIPKPGNVHRGADFEDMTLYDLLWSGQLLGQVIDATQNERVGTTIRQVVEQVRDSLGVNANLGIALLICPLAKMTQRGIPLSPSTILEFLQSLPPEDSADVYAAIRMAAPGGLGKAPRWDIAGPPPPRIWDAMQVAADRDHVALQWATGFADVIDWVAPRLALRLEQLGRLDRAVLAVHVEWIATRGDTLIERKCGEAVSRRASGLAETALAQLDQNWEAFERASGRLDRWLRRDGHRRNPGTTADLIAAGLFVGFAQNQLALETGTKRHFAR